MQSSEQKASEVSYILATIMAKEWWNIYKLIFWQFHEIYVQYIGMKSFAHQHMHGIMHEM